MFAIDDDPVQRYRELLRDVDVAFATIRERNAEHIRCGSGCSACCRARLALSHVEAESLRGALADLPRPVLASIARRLAEPAREYCPALDDEGRCAIYAVRPLICRTIGVPLLHASREPLTQPPVVDICDKNFLGTSPRQVAPRDRLNQTELARRLAEIDAAYCGRKSLRVDERLPLVDVLASAADC